MLFRSIGGQNGSPGKSVRDNFDQNLAASTSALAAMWSGWASSQYGASTIFGRDSRKQPASCRRASSEFSSERFGSPKFARQLRSRACVDFAVSVARISGVPWGVGSPLVNSRTPTCRLSLRQRRIVPPTLISASSGCGAITSKSSGFSGGFTIVSLSSGLSGSVSAHF